MSDHANIKVQLIFPNSTYVNLVGIILESIQVKKTAFGSGLSLTFWNSRTISARVVCRYRMMPRKILSIVKQVDMQ